MENMELISTEFIKSVIEEKDNGVTTNKNIPVMRKYNTLIDMMKSINPDLSNEIIINAALEYYYSLMMPKLKEFLFGDN